MHGSDQRRGEGMQSCRVPCTSESSPPPQHTLLSYFHGVTCVVSRLHKDGPVAQGSYKHSYRWIAQHVLGNARTEAHVENLLRHADVVRGRLVPKAGASSTT